VGKAMKREAEEEAGILLEKPSSKLSYLKRDVRNPSIGKLQGRKVVAMELWR